jgi:hypothetical protein
MSERPLESYSSATLAEFIRRRMISYFPEELDAAERAAAAKRRPPPQTCAATPASTEGK